MAENINAVAPEAAAARLLAADLLEALKSLGGYAAWFVDYDANYPRELIVEPIVVGSDGTSGIYVTMASVSEMVQEVKSAWWL